MTEVALSEIVHAVSGRAGSDADLRVYSVTKHRGFVPSDEYFTKQVFSKDLSTYKVVEAGQFAYATIHLDEGSIGHAPEPCLVSPMYTVFDIDDSRVDRGYLYRLLKSPGMLTRYETIGRGSAERRRSISLEALGRVRVALPPLPEQRRIASILDQVDSLRARRRHSLSLVEEAIDALFIESFGDPLATSQNTTARPLSELTDAVIDCPHTTPVWTSDGVICLRTSNLSRGDWDWSETRFVSEATHRVRVARAELIAGDIILSREGTIGVASIVSENLKASMGQRLVQVRPKAGVTDSEFLLGYLLEVLKPERLSKLLVGSTSQHLNVKDLRALRIDVPSRDLQDKFATRMQRIRAQRELADSHSRLADELFASLQHRAFNGEL